MKRILTAIAMTIISALTFGQVQNYFYVDFGPNDGSNGNETTSPDGNGVYWNNITNSSASSSAVGLVDYQNNPLSASIDVTQGFSKNGINHGGLLAPTAANLGELAVNTATQDYFFSYNTSELQITGLNPYMGYRFHLFGTRSTTSVRKTEYKLTGSEVSRDTLQTSGTDLGGAGYNGNNSTITVTDVMRPDDQGTITLSVSVIQGGFAYLGCMKVEEIDVNPELFIDFGKDDMATSQNGSATVGPDANGHYWNNQLATNASISSFNIYDKDSVWQGHTIFISKPFLSNGRNNGGLLSPDVAKLGEFAVGTVTEDYFFTTDTSEIQFGGLESSSGFVFEVFGTRNTTITRKTGLTFTGATQEVAELQTSGTDLGGSGYHGNNSTILKTDTLYPDASGRIILEVVAKQGGFGYIGGMKIKEYPSPSPAPFPTCDEVDSLRITYMGSSVCWGLGGEGQGYQHVYNAQLDDRYVNGLGYNFNYQNIANPGDNTTKTLDKMSTLMSQCGQYMVLGLSMGNEGLYSGENNQTVYDRYNENLELIKDSAIALGITPVVLNCYSHGLYDSADYHYIKEMNMNIHKWDVPSMNLLGALDAGNGTWVNGYTWVYVNSSGVTVYDQGHPNIPGHAEFFHAIVPSVFDALHEGKALPTKVNGTFISMDKSVDNYHVEFIPEGIVHPFTYSFDIKTTGTGPIASFNAQNGTCDITLNSAGEVVYNSSESAGITTTSDVNDGNWHKITLTHYHARQATQIFVDGVKVGEVAEQLIPSKMVLSDQNGPNADYRELYFYRSGMTDTEISAMHAGEFLKSSLEIYAALDGQNVTSEATLHNSATSTNTLSTVSFNGAKVGKDVDYNGIRVYPNPTSSILNIAGVGSDAVLELYGVTGTPISSGQGSTINVAHLTTGVYYLKVYVEGDVKVIKFNKE